MRALIDIMRAIFNMHYEFLFMIHLVGRYMSCASARDAHVSDKAISVCWPPASVSRRVVCLTYRR